MSIVGPWAIAVYGDKVNWGAAPVPTSGGMSAEETHTFSDAKNVAIYSACKAKGTAWDVLKFATSKEQDGSLLDKTGQMPLRTDLETAFPDYFEAHPEYKDVRVVREPHRRGAQRSQLDRDLAEVPRRVQLVGDLRQDLGRRRPHQGRQRDRQARRPVLTCTRS